MDSLFARYRNAMLLVAVLFLQLVMLAVQVKRDRDVPLIRVWTIQLITPVEKLSSGTIRGVGSLWSNYIDLRHARTESRRLEEEVGRLKLSQYQLQNEAQEARRLKTLLDFKQATPSETVVARVIGSNASETSRVLFLDRGSESGVRRNSAVITADGIVGKVQRVFRGSSQVLVITDPDSGVGALLEKTRAHGAVRGVSGFFCQLRYITPDEKVEPGEWVYTSGEDLIYPKGLPIGTVTTVKAAVPGSIFQEITVQPSARLNRLEEVLVVTRPVDQEIPTRPEAAASEEVPVTPRPPAATQPAAPSTQAGSVPAPDAHSGPEVDADRIVQAYRAAQTGTAEQRATEGLRIAPRAKPLDETVAATAPQPAVKKKVVPAADKTTPNATTPAAKPPAAKPPAAKQPADNAAKPQPTPPGLD